MKLIDVEKDTRTHIELLAISLEHSEVLAPLLDKFPRFVALKFYGALMCYTLRDCLQKLEKDNGK